MHRLDEQDVDPAREQPFDLGDVGIAEVGELDVAERRELGAGADGPDHEFGRSGVEYSAATSFASCAAFTFSS